MPILGGRTKRKLFGFAEGKTPVNEIAQIQKEALEAIDNVNEGHEDFLQAGVVSPSDWSFVASINSATGELASEAATGGTAWLPDPVLSGALMRSVTASAVLSKLKAEVLPAVGKYMTVGVELGASTWGSAATVTVKSVTEYSTQAEAEAHSPAVTAGKVRVRDLVVENAAGVYSIVKQTDRRLWVTGGEAKSETVSEGKTAPETIGTSKLKALAVTAAKIAAGAIETAKLAAGAVTTEKIAEGAVTSAKMAPTIGLVPAIAITLNEGWQDCAILKITPSVASKLMVIATFDVDGVGSSAANVSCRVSLDGGTSSDSTLLYDGASSSLTMVGTVPALFNLSAAEHTITMEAKQNPGSGAFVRNSESQMLYLLVAG